MFSIPSFPDYLVAHRGDRTGGVENTLAGFQAAADAGAVYAECDIQFSHDLVPLVIHDNNLKRLCARPDIRVTDTRAEELHRICAPHFSLLPLSGLMTWLAGEPALTLFVEIKPPIRRRLSDASIVRLLAPYLPDALRSRIVLIGMTAALMDVCARELGCRTGWVAEGMRQPSARMDYVFMPWQKLADVADWQARGASVGLYTVNDAAQAAGLKKAGADLIETNHFSGMVRALA